MTLSFINIGAAKCGTTTLHNILIQHPNLCIPTEKDFHFFDNDANYAKGLDWYARYFRSCDGDILKGEISATYLYSEKAPSRLAKYFGHQLKLILILRNPAERAFSEYLHQKRALNEQVFDFNSYFLNEGQINSAMPMYETVIDRGFYYQHLKQYDSIFGKEQLKICFLEDLKDDPKKVIKGILDFLEVDSEAPIAYELRANEKLTPRFKKIHSMFFSNSNNILRKSLKILVPSFKTRQAIRTYVKKINRQKGRSEEIHPELYDHLMNTVYRNDIRNLETYIGHKIDVWNR